MAAPRPNEPDATPRPQHALAKRFRRAQSVGILLVVVAALAAATGQWLIAVAFALGAGLTRRLAGNGAAEVEAVVRNNLAFEQMSRGDLDGADATLATVDLKRCSSYIQRAVAYQRALHAHLRGNPSTVVRLASACLLLPNGLLARAHTHQVVLEAHALRALALATLNERQRSMADVDAVLDDVAAPPSACARANLARWVLLTKRDDVQPAELTSEFARFAGLMEPLLPQERRLARAIVRSLRPERARAYRESAIPEQDGSLDPWLARLLPGVASHAPQLPHNSRTTLAPGAGPVKPTAEPARPSWVRTGAVALFCAACLGAGVAMSRFEVETAASGKRGTVSDALRVPDAGFLIVAFTVFMGIGVVAALARANREARRLFELSAGLTKPGADRCAATLATMRNGSSGVGASLALTKYLAQRGEFENALAECTQALARLSAQPNAAAAAYDLDHPGLLAERAFLLAALGRVDESTDVLAKLAGQFPAYAYLTAARLRCEAHVAVQRNDLDAARALAAKRSPGLPLPLLDDVLMDVLVAPGSSAREAVRVLSEFEFLPDVRRNLERLAPRALDELRAATET